MVRRKIEIAQIEKDSKRYTTFTKRRKGLFKKTIELCTKFDFVGAAIAITRAGNVFGHAHPHVNTVLSRYFADLYAFGSTENDVVMENSSSDVQLTEETQEVVSEAMKNKTVDLALVNIEFAELEVLEKVLKSMLGDNVVRRREEELRVEDGHAV